MLLSLPFFLLSWTVMLVTANPLPNPESVIVTESGELCRNYQDPSYTQEKVGDAFWADWQQFAGSFCDASGSQPCTISKQDQFETGVEVTIETGIDIGITNILGLSVGISVGFSQSRATAVSTTIGCDPGLVCGLLYRTRLQKVKGDKTQPQNHPLRDCPSVVSDYTATIPVLVPGSNKENEEFNTESEWKACFLGFVDNKYRDVDHIDDYVLCPGAPVTLAYPNTTFTFTFPADPNNVNLHVK